MIGNDAELNARRIVTRPDLAAHTTVNAVHYGGEQINDFRGQTFDTESHFGRRLRPPLSIRNTDGRSQVALLSRNDELLVFALKALDAFTLVAGGLAVGRQHLANSSLPRQSACGR